MAVVHSAAVERRGASLVIKHPSRGVGIVVVPSGMIKAGEAMGLKWRSVGKNRVEHQRAVGEKGQHNLALPVIEFVFRGDSSCPSLQGRRAVWGVGEERFTKEFVR
jgi:hypothetical protein